jgi:tripartite-type tricarboxylate transporter receptor subunit TctC
VKLPRRKFLHLAVGAAALSTTSRIVWAQAYPSRPVRILVGYAAGGPTDIFARLMGQSLSDRLGQQFIIENRPGAAGKIATEAAVRAPPDGYTLLQCGTAAAINATLYDKLNYDFIRDVAPVAGFTRTTLVVVVNPAVPANTIPELIAYAKANPGKINMAMPGIGTSPHLAGELFKTMAGVNITLVTYRGDGPALSDLLGGQVDMMMPAPAAFVEYIRAGKLRALAVTTPTRWEGFPNIPTLGEFVPGYDVSNWWGVCAPKNTSPEIIGKLNNEVNAGLADPKIKERLAQLGADPMPMLPTEFGKLFAEETDKWGKVIRAANIKPE